jgi:hypothetical protein
MSKSGWLVVTVAAVGLMLIPAASAADPQVRFEMQKPFRVGSHDYQAGVIALRSRSAYTPSTSILEVWVNGECLGMMTAHRTVSEQPPERTEALFRRDDDGRLAMVGFRMTGPPAGTTYRFPGTPDVQMAALTYGSN